MISDLMQLWSAVGTEELARSYTHYLPQDDARLVGTANQAKYWLEALEEELRRVGREP